MTRPVRLQLSRAKGFNLQDHSRAVNGLDAMKVDRSTKWGNPFLVVNDPYDRASVVTRFRRCLTQQPTLLRHKLLTITRGMEGRGEGHFARMRAALPEIRGKNLACWCKPGEPCHADVLLEIANRPICEEVTP